MGLHLSRTKHCKHKGSCIGSAIFSSAKMGIWSYLIKTGVSLLFGLRKLAKNPKNLLQNLAFKDSIKFGFYMCAFLLIFQGIICSCRRYSNFLNEKLRFLVGGTVAGTLAALILSQK